MNKKIKHTLIFEGIQFPLGDYTVDIENLNIEVTGTYNAEDDKIFGCSTEFEVDSITSGEINYLSDDKVITYPNYETAPESVKENIYDYIAGDLTEIANDYFENTH